MPRSTDSHFLATQFDRRLSYETVKPYFLGIYASDGDFIYDQNTNDGSGFANDTMYLMRSPTAYTHRGLLQAFGIIDMSSYQLSATEQAKLYSEIANKDTI